MILAVAFNPSFSRSMRSRGLRSRVQKYGERPARASLRPSRIAAIAAINGCRMKRNLIGASARSMSWCQTRLTVSIETPCHMAAATIITSMNATTSFARRLSFCGSASVIPLLPFAWVRLAQGRQGRLSHVRRSAVSLAQLAEEQPIDDYGVDRDHRQYEHAGAPEQEGERLFRRRSVADGDRVRDHVRPEHHREREQSRHKEHGGQGERPSVAAAAGSGEDAVHGQ